MAIEATNSNPAQVTPPVVQTPSVAEVNPSAREMLAKGAGAKTPSVKLQPQEAMGLKPDANQIGSGSSRAQETLMAADAKRGEEAAQAVAASNQQTGSTIGAVGGAIGAGLTAIPVIGWILGPIVSGISALAGYAVGQSGSGMASAQQTMASNNQPMPSRNLV